MQWPSKNQTYSWTAYTCKIWRPQPLSNYKCSEYFKDHRSENVGGKKPQKTLPCETVQLCKTSAPSRITPICYVLRLHISSNPGGMNYVNTFRVLTCFMHFLANLTAQNCIFMILTLCVFITMLKLPQ